MEVIMKINSISEHSVKEATMILADGGVVLIPTDSNYCVVANPFCKEAVERIYKMKKMDREYHPLTLFLEHPVDCEKYAQVTPSFKLLINEFWPGQISFILRKKSGVIPDYVTSGLNTVSFLNHETELIPMICMQLNEAICGSSANLSGKGSVFFLEDAIEQVGSKVDYILDNGPARVRYNNTVVDLTFDPPQIVRIGAVPLEIVKNHIPDVVNDPINYKSLLRGRNK
jgi:L-threonylcarbamoyladenylate synthase